jgi:hypothetical protein
MRKSRKQTKKTNKRFSRNKRINKRYKTRKFRGGYSEEDGFTLVGFLNDNPNNIVGPFIPIFLFNNLEYNVEERNRFSSLKPHIREFRFSHIILPQLYKLKKMRGFNLLRSLRNNMYFYDENGNPVLNNTIIPPDNTVVQAMWDQPKYKNVIRGVELKYPGLFTRIYVTPEEEAEALREIEKKELEKGNTKIEENQELQQIKKTLEEMQRTYLEKEDIERRKSEQEELKRSEVDEEKQATYVREMETTSQMIPYLRGEQKAKKKNKNLKKIDDF